MVPNSLGPAELLLHYGTDEQKNHYLPRLARAWNPGLRADQPVGGFGRRLDSRMSASSARACGRAKEVIGMRVTWDKRYITLGPVCDHSWSRFPTCMTRMACSATKKHIGITCALVPWDHQAWKPAAACSR